MQINIANELKNAREKYTALVPAVEQASLILLALAKSPIPKMNLTDICKEVGIHKSKGYAILNTLQLFGFVERDPNDKRYSLGVGLLALSRKFLDNSNLQAVVSGFLLDLKEKTKSTSFYGVVNEESLFVVAKEEGTGEYGFSLRVGHRFPITAGAHGKAVFTFLPEDEQKVILNKKTLYFHGDPGNLDRDRLEDELIKCRQKGYAEDAGEMQEGINALASPVFDSSGKVIGVIFILGIFSKKLFSQYGALVAKNAEKLSSLFGYVKEKSNYSTIG